MNIRPKLIKRIISGLVLSALTLFILYEGGLLFLLYIILLSVLALSEWVQLSLKTTQKVRTLLFGFIYLSITFICIYLIREQLGFINALLFVFMIWFSDVGAYLFGKLIGGPKMAKTLSPNKTWAGYAGALICPAFFGIGAAYFLHQDQIIIFAVLSVLIGFMGQSGDLLVSFLKRQAGTKDTGDLIPGHGGILDRIDSLLLAAPVFLAFLREFAYGSF